MLPGSKEQRDLFHGRSVADAGFARHLRKGTIYHLLAEHGDRLFPDDPDTSGRAVQRRSGADVP